MSRPRPAPRSVPRGRAEPDGSRRDAAEPGRAQRLQIRVRPGASAVRVGGSYGDPPVLVVAVGARAVDGRANAAALTALAAALGVRPGRLRLVHGATARTKTIEVDPPLPGLATRLAGLIAQTG